MMNYRYFASTIDLLFKLLSFVIDPDLGWGSDHSYLRTVQNVIRFPRTLLVTTLSFSNAAVEFGVLAAYLFINIVMMLILYVRHRQSFHTEGKLLSISHTMVIPTI